MSVAASQKSIASSTKEKLSSISKKRYENPDNIKIMSEAVRIAMRRPEVRKRHIESLRQSGWLKVKTDNGQLGLIEKWNSLGFKFEPNYQVHTDTDLFYLDGYDKEHNVVLEYDSKYHRKLSQKNKDLQRQKRIISILNPKKFWRYDAHTHTYTQILGG